jgi:tripartite ATP-independent transporter DctP family solute receptor
MRKHLKTIALLCLTGLSSFHAVAQTKLRLWNIHPEGYPVTVALESFAKDINERSKGKYQVELFNRGVLGDQPKAVGMLKTGELDMAEFSSGPLSEAVPGLKALNLPFLFKDTAHMFRHLDGKLGDSFAEKLKASGFVVLGWYNGGARSFYCSHKPITSVRDLEGTKIRTLQSEVFIEMAKQLSATSVSLPFKDVMAGLEQKKIDCAENNMPSYESTGHYKAAKYVYMSNHVISPEALVISQQAWSKLSAEDQKMFLESGRKSATLMRSLWADRVKEAIEKTTKAGSSFVEMRDVHIMIRRLGPLYGKYMNDPVTRGEVLTIIADK